MKKHAKRILKLFTIIISLFTVTCFAGDSLTGRDYVHDERFDDHIIADGVDISTYQGMGNDWEEAKASGVDFAIIRLTLTFANSGNITVDRSFEEHFKEVGDAGIMRGVYVFSQARNAEEGDREAEYAIATLEKMGIGPGDLDLPVYMDYEFYHKESSRLSDLTREDAIAAAKAFCSAVQRNGYEAGIYANTTFFHSYLDDGAELPEGVSVWCAQYNSSNNSASPYSIWQYSSTANVDGIYDGKGLDDVDADFWYIEKRDDSDLDITAENNVEYTGGPVLPELTITDGDRELKEGVDYIVRGIENIEGGYAYVKGIGEYSGHALVKLNVGTDFAGLDLPSEVIETSYSVVEKGGHTTIRDIPEDMTAGEFLKGIRTANESFRAGITDSHGNELSDTDTVTFDCMLGIFNGDTLIGTMDIETEEEILNGLF